MARDFTKDTANYMGLGIHQLGALMNGASAVSLHCRVNIDSVTTDAGGGDDFLFVAIGNSPFTGISFRGRASGAQTVVSCQARSGTGEGAQAAVGSTILSTGTDYSVGTVINYAGDKIRIYVNGTQEADTTVAFGNSTYVTGTPTTVADTLGCGITVAGTAPTSTHRQLDGSLSECALWVGDIATAGFEQLADGVDARLVRPDLLVFFMALRGDNLRDMISGKAGTITGTVATRDHPRIIMPRRRFAGVPTAAAAGGLLGPLIGGSLRHGTLIRGGRLAA